MKWCEPLRSLRGSTLKRSSLGSLRWFWLKLTKANCVMLFQNFGTLHIIFPPQTRNQSFNPNWRHSNNWCRRNSRRWEECIFKQRCSRHLDRKHHTLLEIACWFSRPDHDPSFGQVNFYPIAPPVVDIVFVLIVMWKRRCVYWWLARRRCGWDFADRAC